ncbi:HAD-superfamily phosphatase, subfamily IIIC/FkbH-like domain-containing protein [Pseudobutyrivibrio sp. YE44]|uniref:HAD-IIIC family phosphatase n=1 Tax=Pseudobutyrivibrio sp. YE44 TaxID=1520802 RepID=UPI00088BE5C3|nr:HAD-IIIC family phosphatase [Pseudobutyrivibrio sp. YE44]SDB38522.1 HAD-superfamily phosphatase, subfamily IIIC/FkbH-like domain-containing protein [Pseudobutyrivibrio sp. YE44]
MRELEYPFDSEFIRKKRIKLRKQLLADESVKFIEKRIAILGGSTTSEIKNMIELFLLNNGIKPSFYESEYNKFYEDGMFDNPELVEFDPEIIYIHTSNRNITDWPTVADGEDTVKALLDAQLGKFVGLWEHLFEKYHCPIIQNNFEMPFYRLLGNQDAVMLQGRSRFVNLMNEGIYDYARSHENFFIHDINYESATYGLAEWSNPLYWHMYKYAVAVPAIPYTAYGVATIIKSFLGKNKKVLALDLDNTLWGGVIGDDGVENIEIGQETSLGQTYSEFQNYVKEQKQIGTLLTVITKNNDDVARTGFERPDSVLKIDDFVSFKANWDPKDRNLVEEANELNLLPESFVFVDDNPAEREIIRQSIPGVAVPEIGNVEEYIQTIDRAGYFEVTKLSADDMKRNEMYAANAKRNIAQASFTDYGEYLKSLEMIGTIKPFEDIYMSRIAQLSNKSNQFNLTTHRYTQAEIEEIAASGNHITLYGKLEDKFGDNGVVSVVIGEVKSDELHMDLWLMSCRVLKRDMEFAMMDELVSACKAHGITKIFGYYYPTAKNAMVKDFYGIQGFEKIAEDQEGNTTWQFNIPQAYENKNKAIKVN